MELPNHFSDEEILRSQRLRVEEILELQGEASTTETPRWYKPKII
jgi:hypothetical protein